MRYPTLSEYESMKIVGELPSVGWLRTKRENAANDVFHGSASILKRIAERLEDAVE